MYFSGTVTLSLNDSDVIFILLWTYRWGMKYQLISLQELHALYFHEVNPVMTYTLWMTF